MLTSIANLFLGFNQKGHAPHKSSKHKDKESLHQQSMPGFLPLLAVHTMGFNFDCKTNRNWNYQNPINHQRAGTVCKSNWILSVRYLLGPELSNGMSMTVLSQPRWAWGGQVRSRKMNFFLGTKHNLFVSDSNARCTAQPPKLSSLIKVCLASMLSFRAGGALGGPCWPYPAQLPNKEVS
eukprot:1160689-Pelagomonas_calceolata.AAC.4